ncbi:MAG: DNA double-strand break repair nuclease NurA [Actinomycetota bacterium]
MALDLRQVVGQVASMSAALGDPRREYAERLDQAIRAWDSHWADTDRLRGKLEAAKTSWLLARPLEPPGAYPAPEMTAPAWRVCATDGSQIEVSRHEVADCYLINVGEVTLDYGESPGASMTNAPFLFHEADDLHPLYGGEDRPADGAIVATVRDTAELEYLAALVSKADRPAVALVDGTLILWRDEVNANGLARLAPEDLKRKRLDAMLNLFEAGREMGVPIVGYVSSPGGTDVINALKVMICPEHPVDCDRCPFTPAGLRRTQVKDKPCDAVDRLTDQRLFARFLTKGERSPLFWSGAPVLEAYGEHRIAFCYLDTGYEIARLEVPAWVANDPRVMSFAHAVAYDQAVRGRGYPVALAEAHEACVVRGADREAFFALVTRRLVRDGHRVSMSRKQVGKRGALV